MPELPEVETIRLGLQKYLVGHRVLSVEVRVAKIFQGDVKQIIGTKVIGVNRVGKVLVIELDNNYAMVVHLKLTGQIIYSGKDTGEVTLSKKTSGDLPSKYTHVILTLDRGSFLYYNDLRKFGWIRVIKKDEIWNLPFFKEMGPEPPVVLKSKIKNPTKGEARQRQQKSKPSQAWSKLQLVDRTTLTFDKFKETVKSEMPIKVLLMDQKKIGGIGNIYANEALFLAKIDPRRKSKSLSDAEINKLYDSIIEVLKRGLRYGGSSDVNFVNALGEDGNYQNHFLVYARKGEKCRGCPSLIKKIQLGGRGTYFCPVCQH